MTNQCLASTFTKSCLLYCCRLTRLLEHLVAARPGLACRLPACAPTPAISSWWLYVTAVYLLKTWKPTLAEPPGGSRWMSRTACTPVLLPPRTPLQV
jgi:hypothetical protein